MSKLRKTLILKWEEIEPRDIKKGDIFRMLGASDQDLVNVNPQQILHAKSDAVTVSESRGYAELQTEDLALVKQIAIRS